MGRTEADRQIRTSHGRRCKGQRSEQDHSPECTEKCRRKGFDRADTVRDVRLNHPPYQAGRNNAAFDSFFSYSFCLISNHSTRLCIDLTIRRAELRCTHAKEFRCCLLLSALNFSCAGSESCHEVRNPVRSNAIPGGHRLRSYGFSIRTSRRTVHLHTMGRAKKALWPLISKRLVRELDTLQSCEDDYYRRYGDYLRANQYKPATPWLEDGLFSGPNEAASPSKFSISAARPSEKIESTSPQVHSQTDLLLRLSNAVRPL